MQPGNREDEGESDLVHLRRLGPWRELSGVGLRHAAVDIDVEMLVFDEFLWECLLRPHMHPGNRLTLDHPEGHECEMVNGRVCFTGAIVWWGNVAYRIGEYVADAASWWARWPD